MIKPARKLYRLPADAVTRRALAEWLRAAAARGPVLWVGHEGPAGLPHVAPAQVGHWLGQEVDALVFEASTPLAVDALVLAAGLLRGGGVLVLVDAGTGTGHFARRWRAALAEPWIRHPVSPSGCGDGLARTLALPRDEQHGFAWTEDQTAALDRLQAVAPGDCLALIAPRGRGKSTVLGRMDLARRHRKEGDAQHHVDRAVPARRTGAAGTRASAGGRSRTAGSIFQAPEVLLQRGEPVDTLVIDEAANLPVDRLLRLAKVWRGVWSLQPPRGASRGVARASGLRALPALRAAGFRLQWQTLTTPVRWAPGIRWRTG